MRGAGDVGAPDLPRYLVPAPLGLAVVLGLVVGAGRPAPTELPAAPDTTVSVLGLPEFLTTAEPVYEIGALDGPEEEVFGDIADAVFDARGRLLVLDAQAKSIRVFDSAGAFVHSLGREGEGPGEYVRPDGLTIGPEGSLYVIDAYGGRVTVYRATEVGYEFDESFGTLRTAQDICALGDRLYLTGGSGRSLVYVTSLEGEKTGSFGAVGGPNRIVREGKSDGRIACVEPAAAVVFVTSRTGRAYAFSAAGDSLWTRRLQGFLAQEITPTARGARYSRGPDGIDVTRSVVPLFGDAVVVQTEWYDPFDRYGTASEDALTTYGFGASSGLQVRLPDPLPWILARSGTRLAVKLTSPYPRIQVFDLAARDGP